MASFCAQHLRCRSHLCSKTVTLIIQYFSQFHHCSARRGTVARNAASFISDNHTSYQLRERGKQHKCYYSTVKHVESEVKGNEYSKELSGMDFVSVKSPLSQITDVMPVTENQISLNLDVIPELSALEEIGEDEAISISVPSAMPSAATSLKEYVDQSETLSKLVQLGVNLWKLEQRPNVGSMLLRLDFETDVVPRLLFLKDIGVEDSRFGHIITQNPFILTESLENLQTRVKYLKSKKFNSETVASMVSRAPYLLNFSVKRLDNRLGFYQQELGLSVSNIRNIVARLPRLLCGSLEPVKENLKVCEIEFGLKRNEIQHIVVAVPKVLTANKKKLTQIFNLLHNTMNIPHRLIVKFPQVFNSKYLRIRERHLFLQYLGKAQYDPAQSNYISLDRLVFLPDETFCTEVALATLDDFYLFQKTL